MDHSPHGVSIGGTWSSVNEPRQTPSEQDTSGLSWRGSSHTPYTMYNTMPLNISQWNINNASYHQASVSNVENPSKPFTSMNDGVYMNVPNVKQELTESTSTITGLVPNEAFDQSHPVTSTPGTSLLSGLMTHMLADTNEHVTDGSKSSSSVNSACNLMIDMQSIKDDTNIQELKEEKPDVHDYIGSQFQTNNYTCDNNLISDEEGNEPDGNLTSSDREDSDGIADQLVQASSSITKSVFSMPVIKKAPPRRSRHRSRITWGNKKEICQYRKDNPKVSLRQIAKYFTAKYGYNVGRTTVGDITGQQDRWLSMSSECDNQMRKFSPKSIELDTALYNWYLEAIKRYPSGITNDVLIAKGREIGNELNIKGLAYSNGWLYSFKKRHKILNPMIQGAPSNPPGQHDHGNMQPKLRTHSTKKPAFSGNNVIDKIHTLEKQYVEPINKIQLSNKVCEKTVNESACDVTGDQACLALMTTITYLQSHPNIAGDYVDVLWKIYELIEVHVRLGDMGSTRHEHFTPDGVINPPDLDIAAGSTTAAYDQSDGDTVSEGSAVIKTEIMNSDYDDAESQTDVDQPRQDVGEIIPEDSECIELHACSVCNQQFGAFTELLQHMTSHVSGSSPGQDISVSEPESATNVEVTADVNQDICNEVDGMQTSKQDSETGGTETELTSPIELTEASHSEVNELEKLKNTIKRSHVCKICDKAFNNYSNLRRHVRNHSGKKPHKCPTCGKCFFESAGLKIHSTVHTGEKTHLCVICGKCFSQNAGLRCHMTTHTGERPHGCNNCGKRFPTLMRLKEHERSHTGERPYQCSMCGKKFIRKTELTTHERTHTGERPFKCKICGQGFSQRNNMRKHFRNHGPERPFDCKTCGKAFKDKYLLIAHERVHSGEKPFSCNLCGRSFSQTGSLFHHMKMHKP